jgi:MoaA/NifB/PqqE/SkfB family radical SAM enzyme
MRTSPAENNPPQGLSFLWLEITGKCNLECSHCYADSGPRQDLFGQMSTEDWLSVLRQSAALGCEQVQFIGGEPTLHPDLPRMIAFAASCGYSLIEVYTNLTVVNENLLGIFVRYGVCVATSFYSDDPDTHDSITGHRGSFNRTVRNIERCVAAGVPVRAGVVETAENAGHGLRAQRFLESLGVTEIKIDLQRGVGRAKRQLHSLEPMAELCGECWNGKLCVTPHGRAYPCVFSRFKDLGSIRDGLSHILGTSALREFRTALKGYLRKNVRYEMHVCSPHLCDPTGSSCGPSSFCTPETSAGPCNPDTTKCSPHYQPCSPERPCGPTTGPCGPERERDH